MQQLFTHPRFGGEIREVYARIKSYYSRKVSRYGATPLGVDWSCVPAQELRFMQLVKLCDFSVPFSLNDLGCGYGALLTYLAKRYSDTEVDYLGIDLAPAMVRKAERLWGSAGHRKFVVGHSSPRIADYSVASGIFNVKLDQPIARWERFVAFTLQGMAEASRHGFAVNFMGSLPKANENPSILYRTPVEPWIRYGEQELGCSVELLTNYGLHEMTLLLRK